MAFAWASIGIIVGTAFGMRFKVFVLAPTIAVAVMLALIVGLSRGDSFWSIVFAMVIVWLAIQVGYLIAIFLAKRIQPL